jgi:hypothetical protein
MLKPVSIDAEALPVIRLTIILMAVIRASFRTDLSHDKTLRHPSLMM